MDTDELSIEAYKGILIEAEKFDRDLKLHYGLIADSCKNEREYLLKAKASTKSIISSNKNQLANIFFCTPPVSKNLYRTLEKILASISKIEEISEEKRHYEF